MKYCTMGKRVDKKLHFDELKPGDVFRFDDNKIADENIYMRLTNEPETEESRYVDLDDGEILFAPIAMENYQVEIYNGRIEFFENDFDRERK